MEDQALVLGALAALLELEDDMEIVGTATTAEDGLKEVKELRPDILLTDIELPGMSGLELSQSVHQDLPECRVMIVTTFARAGYLQRALKAGVRGYVLKDSPVEQLADSIRRVFAGQKAIDPELAVESWEESDPLTDREREVLRHAMTGMSTADIAKTVFLSEGTVRNYLSEAISKLHGSNRIDAARIAHQKGWL